MKELTYKEKRNLLLSQLVDDFGFSEEIFNRKNISPHWNDIFNEKIIFSIMPKVDVRISFNLSSYNERVEITLGAGKIKEYSVNIVNGSAINFKMYYGNGMNFVLRGTRKSFYVNFYEKKLLGPIKIYDHLEDFLDILPNEYAVWLLKKIHLFQTIV